MHVLWLYDFLTTNPGLFEGNATASISCSMLCSYWKQTVKFLQLCKNCIIRGTWCHGNNQEILPLHNGTPHDLNTRRREVVQLIQSTDLSSEWLSLIFRSAFSPGQFARVGVDGWAVKCASWVKSSRQSLPAGQRVSVTCLPRCWPSLLQ